MPSPVLLGAGNAEEELGLDQCALTYIQAPLQHFCGKLNLKLYVFPKHHDNTVSPAQASFLSRLFSAR